jgi:DNA-binding Xre family transcriptional regulator
MAQGRISFGKLDALLIERGKKWQYLRDSGISPGIVAKLKNGTGHTDTRTIERVCEILDCQPGDIMEYKPKAEGEPLEKLNRVSRESSK